MRFKSKGPKFETVGTAPSEEMGSDILPIQPEVDMQETAERFVQYVVTKVSKLLLCWFT
jgi:hypothetical protein